MYLLEDVSENVTGQSYKLFAGDKRFRIYADNFGAATVTIQEKTSKGTWESLTSVTDTFIDEMSLSPNNVEMRAIVTGADGNTSNISVEIL